MVLTLARHPAAEHSSAGVVSGEMGTYICDGSNKVGGRVDGSLTVGLSTSMYAGSNTDTCGFASRQFVSGHSLVE